MRVALSHLVLFSAALVACGARNTDAAALHVPAGFSIEKIADVDGARELVTLPNGDLIVGTEGRDVYIVPDAEGAAGSPQVFAAFDDEDAAGVAFAADRREIFVGTRYHVWAIPYRGERTASTIRRVANVRTGPIAPGTDGDVHWTTSVAYTDGLLYAAAGSSCNATMDDGKAPCVEVDPTRAAVSVMKPDGSGFTQRAKRIRNAIALAVNPETHSLWIGGAGQDDLPFGHPYEILDNLSSRAGDADYGWPECEENHHAYVRGANCAGVVVPFAVVPAYATIIGAAFYPEHQAGNYVFPAAYRGGLFVATHGSWHTNGNGCNAQPPRVVFVPMSDDRPARAVDWQDPTKQWSNFVTGFQTGCNARSGRPTGVAVGPKGSLFIADDAAGAIYRVRPLHRE
jgi:glucose/arabinose dehydrogenase